MIFGCRCQKGIVGAIGLLMMAGILHAQGGRIATPEGVFYHQPAASVFGSEAVWVNPAGLGFFNPAGFQLMADYADGKFVRSWGFVTQADQLAIAYRSLDLGPDSSYKQWIYAGGLPIGTSMALGASYSYYSRGPGIYRKMHSWIVGFQSRGGGPFSWGGVVSNLNRAKTADGRRSEIEQRYSIAYRPSGNKVTLAVDLFLSSRTRFKNGDVIYNLEFTPRDGLFINGHFDSHKNFGIGVRVNLVKYFAGTRSRFSRSGSTRGSTSFAGMTSLRQPSIVAQPQRTLSLGLSGSVPENPPQPLFGVKRLPFTTIVTSVYRAAEDPSIRELNVSLRDLKMGFGKAQELREALLACKRAHKRVVCHIQEPSNLSYYVASAADSIFIPPVSQLRLVGLRAELTFYAGTLDKLGVKIDLLRIGAHKSAAEMYTRTSASDENREQVNRLLDDFYSQFVGTLAEARRVGADSMRNLIDQGPYTSAEALRLGLVDGLAYADDFERRYSSRSRVSLSEYVKDTLVNDDWNRAPTLAVVVAEGDIEEDATGLSPLGGDERLRPEPMRSAFRYAARDPQVKGIVLRVDSPGGSALASNEIFHDVQSAASQKPLVVSMGNVAASGGYYVAMAAQRIFANPATVTGSVGIFGGKVDYSGLYQKIALTKELYTRGKYAGMMTTLRPFTDEERAKYFDQLNAFYGHFVGLVAANRKMSNDSVDQLGQGRVWSGREGIANGLVDEIGGVKQSLDFTAMQLGLGRRYSVAIYPQRRPLFILPGWSLFGMLAGLTKSERPLTETVIEELIRPTADGIYARLPYDIDIR